MPNNPEAGGISRRIEGDDRAELRDKLANLTITQGAGVIIRTAGVGRTVEELQWDLDYLDTAWQAIKQAALSGVAPFLIYQESNVIVRAIRDYLRQDIGEVLVDSEQVFEKVKDLVQQVMPSYGSKIKRYQDETPSSTAFRSRAKSSQHSSVKYVFRPADQSLLIRLKHWFQSTSTPLARPRVEILKKQLYAPI